MANLKVLLAFALLATASSSFASSPASDLPKPSYARTMLKVSRSLPGETEELKVRTSEGNVATLIVKRREKSVSSDIPVSNESSSDATTTTTMASTNPTTIGYQNVEVDPWNRLQTWSSVSSSKMSSNTEQENESRNWVPVNRGFDSWKPVQQPFASEEPKRTSWLVADQMQNSRSFQTIPADDNSNERIIRYAFLPHEPRRAVRTNVGANLMKNRDAKNVPPEVVVRSEINVKPQPGQPQMQAKRLPMTLDVDGTPIVHGRRVPDDPIDKIQVWRNARVINDQLVTDASIPGTSSTTAKGLPASGQNFERFFEDVNRRYSKTPDDNSIKSKTYRNEALAAEIYETAEETYRPSIRKRMLQPDIAAVYPNSRIYSPPDQSPPPKSSVPSVKPGTRAPVLQYAHPELGVQPAKIIKNEKRKTEEIVPETSSVRPSYGYQNQGQGHYYGEHRQKKKYVLNDKNIVDSYTYKDYYPNQHFYGLKRPMAEAPFWVKISQNLKSQFTDGVAKVSELTKPVFDPLVEATRKISENLGLSGSRSQDPAQDKVGSVATSSSVLIPALGLVASGAALGIGAVAVGRYLDVDVLKRSNEGVGLELNENNQRALDIVSELQQNEQAMSQVGSEKGDDSNNVYILVQDDRNNAGLNRRKRSNVDEDYSRRMQRKGADEIAEIVEIDLPSRSLDDSTNSEGNDLYLENEEALAKAIVQQTLEAISSSSRANKDQSVNESTRTRRRRSLDFSDSDAELIDALQNLERAEEAEVGNGHIPGDWSNTPCAKRIFCDAMVKRGSDASIFMEKKMSGLLRMIQPGAAVQVSAHFDEVMDAVRRHDCSVFSCPQARPASLFF